MRSVEAGPVVDYLHDVVDRLVRHRYATSTDVDTIESPAGVGLVLRGDRATGRIVSGAISFEPLFTWGDLEPWVERTVERADGICWLLLREPEPRVSSSLPSRVTVILPARPEAASDPVPGALLAVPDSFTSPTGLVPGMAVEGTAALDVAALVAGGGPFAAIVAAIGTDDPIRDRDVSGLRWCDGPAQRLDGFVYESEWFGLPPTFVPILSVGVDGLTLGFLWDRADREPIDDSTLYLVAPGDGFRLQDRVPFGGWVAGELARRRDDAEVDASLVDAIRTAIGAPRAVGDEFRHGIKRPKPRDLADDERWLTVPNGDGVRVPADSVAATHPRSFADPAQALEWAAVASTDGRPGSAIWAAYRALVDAAEHCDAFSMHAAYRAMIEPLERLDRAPIAARCRAFTETAVPIVCEPPAAPPAPAPVWLEPVATRHEAPGAVVAVDGPDVVTLDVDGRSIDLHRDRLGPVDVADLPAATLLGLLDTGAFSVSPEGRIADRSHRPVVGARHHDSFVALIEHEQPGLHVWRLEAVVPWLDNAERLRPVRYAPITVVPDTYTAELERRLLTIEGMPELYTAKPPFEFVDADFSGATATMGEAALHADVVTSTGPYGTSLHGLVMTDRCARIVLGSDPSTLPGVPVRVGGETVTRRYLNTPVVDPVDARRSTFVVKDLDTGAVVEHLGAGVFADPAEMQQTKRSDRYRYPRVLDAHVRVLTDTPRLMRL